jgi:hypothetical protein
MHPSSKTSRTSSRGLLETRPELLEALPPSCRDAVIAAGAARDFLLPGFHQLARPQAVQHRVNAPVLDLRSGLFDKQREEYL